MRAGEAYEHPFERLVVRDGTAESDGRELVADLYVRADAPGVPRHLHPMVAETVTVIRGKVSAWSPAQGERILGPGETCEIVVAAEPSAGCRHRPMVRRTSTAVTR